MHKVNENKAIMKKKYGSFYENFPDFFIFISKCADPKIKDSIR